MRRSTLMTYYLVTIKSLDDVIKWENFPRYWPFVRGIRRSPVNSPHKGQWRGALMFSLNCVCRVNNREAGDLRPYRAHYDVIVIETTDENDDNVSKSWHHLAGEKISYFFHFFEYMNWQCVVWYFQFFFSLPVNYSWRVLFVINCTVFDLILKKDG